MRALFLFLLLPALIVAQPLARKVDEVLARSTTAQKAHWGMRFVDLASGQILYERNGDSYFVPASNTKLFSTALALTRLGPDYRFQTRVESDARPDSRGRIEGDIRLIGGGDPTMSGRAMPYRKGPITGNPLQAVEELAEQVVAAGVKFIGGDVVGDDTAYVWEPYPPGWSEDDTKWEYGAPVSALTINDNAIKLRISAAAKPGEPAVISLEPAVEYYFVHNYVRTIAKGEGSIRIDRGSRSRELEISGQLPVKTNAAYLVALDDPALFAARVLRDALIRRGVTVRGRAIARHRRPMEVESLKRAAAKPSNEGIVLAKRTSPPLVEILQVINKVSQNLHAELALRETARVRRGIGSAQAGLEEMKQFLEELGISADDCRFEDGSGLSRLTIVTPRAITTLLTKMAMSPYAEAWRSFLPVGGVDGTLEKRFVEDAANVTVRAKTGTLSHVAGLSGYAEGKNGAPIVFSILVNNFRGPSSEVRSLIDKITVLIASAR